MGKGITISDSSGVLRKVNTPTIGTSSGENRKIKNGTLGVNGVNRIFYTGCPYDVSFWMSDDTDMQCYFADHYCGVKDGSFYFYAKVEKRSEIMETAKALSLGISIKNDTETLHGKTITFDFEQSGFEYSVKTTKYYEFAEGMSGDENSLYDDWIKNGASSGTFTKTIGSTVANDEVAKIWLNVWVDYLDTGSIELTVKNLMIGDVNISEYFTNDQTI